MKKILKLISGVVQAVMAALLFVPISLWNGDYIKNVADLYNYYQGNTTEYPGYELLGEYESISFFYRVTGVAAADIIDKVLLILFYILLALLIIGLLWTVLQIFTKLKKHRFVTFSIAAVQTVVLVVFLIRSLKTIFSDALGYDDFSPNVGFYIMIALALVNLTIPVIEFLKKRREKAIVLEPMEDIEQEEVNCDIVEDAPTNPKTQAVNAVSDVEELKKYKELLDSGIITQEEFDAKKKQLLGI